MAAPDGGGKDGSGGESTSLLAGFPRVEWAFAYGSAAVPQAGYDASDSMLDLILVVSDATAWHLQNRQMNPSHYHTAPRLDPWLQRSAAGLYYIPDVQVAGRRTKYGVMQLDDCFEDLVEWRTLYVAGRLHKAVHFLLPPSPELDRAIQENRRHVVNVAQLLLPPRFTQEELLASIIGISYLGDFRMGWAEDVQKIGRILKGQHHQLWSLYADAIDAVPIDGHSLRFSQDVSPMRMVDRLTRLPAHLARRVARQSSPFLLARQPESIRPILAASIAATVRLPALTQAAKGVLTAGIGKSVSYALAKLGRRFL